MTSSLVGSEMCIRDRYLGVPNVGEEGNIADLPASRGSGVATASGASSSCLLYTSDAADDM
eukprot:10332598-Prorocentrum_lima.AAC.1